MENLVVDVKSMRFVPHRWLFQDDILRILSDITERSSIYSLSVSKKIRFNVEQIEILDNENIKITIEVGGQNNITHNFNCLKYIDENNNSKKTDNLGIEIHPESDEFMIIGKVVSEDNVSSPFFITMENVISDLNIDLRVKSEIVYVGQSHKLVKRLQSHNKINQALSELSDRDELRINFYEFEIGGVSMVGDITNEAMFHMKKLKDNYLDKTSGVYKDFISLIERNIIHFYKPKYNIQHVDTPPHKDQKVRKILRKRGIKKITIGLGMIGPNWMFWSDKQSLDNEGGTYDFSKPELGWYS